DTGVILAELTKTAEDAKRQLTDLLAVARPPKVIGPGGPVGAAITQAVEVVRELGAIAVDLHLTVPAEVTTRCSAQELEHLIVGLVLDAAAFDAVAIDAETEGTIELFVRDRTIEGKPWLEI